MSKGTTMSRRQRRMDLRRANMLKIKNMFSFFSPQRQAWYSKMAEDGAAAHEANVKRNEDATGDRLQTILNSLKETWAGMGYNEAEITMLEEAWTLTVIKDSETYREDKKASRKLMKQAQESRSQRS